MPHAPHFTLIGRISLGNARNFAFWIVLMVLVLALFNLFNGDTNGRQSNEKTYSEFVASVNAGEVRSVELDGEKVMLESLLSFKRAGCDGILTYFAPSAARLLGA